LLTTIVLQIACQRPVASAQWLGHSIMRGMADESRELRAFAPALVLLAIFALINFIDRGNLSIAAPLLKEELRISASELGILLSAFFWTYTAMQFVSGWIVDRFDVNRVIAAGFLLWSLATAATGLVRGFAMLLAMRLMLGIGESVMSPAYSKILSFHLPEHHRGFANGVLQAAVRSGPAVGTLATGLLIARYGWRPAFIGIGLISLAWIPAWIKWMPRGGATRRCLPDSPGFADILRQKSFWGVCAGHFSVIYLLYFMLTWLPFYLVHERHLSLQSMTKIASAYYLIDALSAITTGWLSDSLIRGGYTPTLVRKSAMAIGHTIAGIALVGCALANSQWYLVCLVAIGVGEGVAGSGPFAFSQTLAGPHATGKWTGLQNGFANLSGVVAPALTGFLVDRTGNFLAALGITAAVLVAGGLSWVFAVGRVEQVTWKSEPLRAPVAAASV
jgi:MFS transporter, ACS family, D-galactonate transporter